MEGKRAWPERDGPYKPSLHPGLLGVQLVLTASTLTALVGIQRLLQLLLQYLIPALQFVHFGQKASEPQVEGLEYADVGAQVVPKGHGCRGVRLLLLRRRGCAVLVGAAVGVVEVRGGLRMSRLIGPRGGLITQEKRGRVRCAERGFGEKGGGGVRVSGGLALLGVLLEMRVGPQQRIHAMVFKTKALQIWHELGRRNVLLQQNNISR